MTPATARSTATRSRRSADRVALDADPGVLVAPVSVGTRVAVDGEPRPRGRWPPADARGADQRHPRGRRRDFKAEVVSIAEGEGARWALTRNLRPTGGKLPDTFLKRIGTVGDPVSIQLPLDADPVGPIAAVGGAVWVPLRDGVLQYDPATARSCASIDLPERRPLGRPGRQARVRDRRATRSAARPCRGLGDTDRVRTRHPRTRRGRLRQPRPARRRGRRAEQAASPAPTRPTPCR